MNFDLEGMLDSAKEKAVNAATEKFGSSAQPIAEKVAGKMEDTIANKLGVALHNKEAAPSTDSASNDPSSGDANS